MSEQSSANLIIYLGLLFIILIGCLSASALTYLLWLYDLAGIKTNAITLSNVCNVSYFNLKYNSISNSNSFIYQYTFTIFVSVCSSTFFAIFNLTFAIGNILMFMSNAPRQQGQVYNLVTVNKIRFHCILISLSIVSIIVGLGRILSLSMELASSPTCPLVYDSFQFKVVSILVQVYFGVLVLGYFINILLLNRQRCQNKQIVEINKLKGPDNENKSVNKVQNISVNKVQNTSVNKVQNESSNKVQNESAKKVQTIRKTPKAQQFDNSQRKQLLLDKSLIEQQNNEVINQQQIQHINVQNVVKQNRHLKYYDQTKQSQLHKRFKQEQRRYIQTFNRNRQSQVILPIYDYYHNQSINTTKQHILKNQSKKLKNFNKYRQKQLIAHQNDEDYCYASPKNKQSQSYIYNYPINNQFGSNMQIKKLTQNYFTDNQHQGIKFIGGNNNSQNLRSQQLNFFNQFQNKRITKEKSYRI